MPRRQRSQCLPYFIALANVLILFDQAHAHLADDAAPAKNNRHTPITDRNDAANQNHRRISQMNPSQRSPRTPSELHELIDTLESKAAEAAAQHHFMELPGEPRSFTETRSFDNHAARDNNLNSSNGASKVMPDLRIINGESAPETRYPYAVSLQYNRQHSCGGSLIAPDIVLTAGHCTGMFLKATLGRYDLDNYADTDFEVMGITKEILHPDYDDIMVNNDFAIMVLERMSIHPYIEINADGDVPVNGEELRVMGWGDIDPDSIEQETSDELRETEVTYMMNADCEKSVGFVETQEGPVWAGYQDGITDDMMCALDNVGVTSDACQGDSGGPLVKLGSDASGADDIQVGIVSWGFSCADVNFPGVYSRLSSQYDWMRNTICENSMSPPEYLNCDPISTGGGITNEPTPSPVTAQQLKGLITIFVETDPTNPEDLGWELTSVPDGEVVQSAPVGYYAGRFQEALMHEVIVDPENFYKLTIYDIKSDGFLGYMTVFRGRSYVTSDTLVLEPGFSSISGSSVVHGFYVGDDPPLTLTLDIEFDSHPEEFSWSITNVEDDLPLGFKWFAWYGGDFISARETIPIYGSERGSQQYVLEVLDAVGDGLCCDHGTGSYALYLGYPSNQSRITHGGKFLVEEFYAFEIDSSGQILSTPKPVIKPTPPPTKLPTPNPTTPQVLNPNPAPTTQGSTTLEFYAVPSTGLCAVNDSNKPSWINKVYTDYDLCCQESAWNKQACFSSKPAEANITPSNKPTMAQETGNLIEFTPVTGTFTCEKPGLTCTIICSSCGSIERDANGMLMQFPNKSTIVYTSTRGMSDSPNDPPKLILVETNIASTSSISCDEGCSCNIVDNDILGCGFVPQADDAAGSEFTLTKPNPQPFPTNQETPNGAGHTSSFKIFLLCTLLTSLVMLR